MSELLEIASALKYESCEKDKPVFNFGDEGDRFYLILDGKCEVFVPMLQT